MNWIVVAIGIAVFIVGMLLVHREEVAEAFEGTAGAVTESVGDALGSASDAVGEVTSDLGDWLDDNWMTLLVVAVTIVIVCIGFVL